MWGLKDELHEVDAKVSWIIKWIETSFEKFLCDYILAIFKWASWLFTTAYVLILILWNVQLKTSFALYTMKDVTLLMVILSSDDTGLC